MTEKELMSDNPTITLSDAIAAARAGRREEATSMLRQITADDHFNADAWVWLGGLATDPREQRSALEQALRIQPDHARARQGLAWLRQQHPEVFDDPVSHDDAPAGATTTPHDDSHVRVYDAPTVSESAVAPTYLAQSAADARMAAAEAPTRAMPVYSEPVTDRMPVAVPVAPPTATTDRMAVPPPAPAMEQEAYQRSTGAEIARWLLTLLWLAGLGAAATLAALLLLYPARFEPLVNSALAPYNLQLVPELAAQTRLGTTIGLVVLAIINAFVAMGLIARRHWAWVINLLVALLVTAGAVALWVAFFQFTPGANLNTLLSPQGSPLIGLGLFAAIYLVLSFASRRAFFRRRMAPAYER